MALLPTFTTLGSGATVLMLHDADGDHLTFAPQVEALATAGYRAVAWNMPGYGRSAPIEPYSFKGLAESCLLLIEALQCGSVSLVGHGMGAMVALEVAVRKPAAVRRLVLCAGGPALDAQATQDWVAPRLAALQALEQGGSMEQLANTLVPRFIGTGALPEGARLATHALSQVYPGAYRRALQAMGTFDRGAAALRSLSLPTLLVGGGQDRCTPPEALQALAQVMPDAEHLNLPHVGHWPQLEDPEGFGGALMEFLVRPRVLH
ncbi:alpha/beta hydrolase [Acidovorax sp. Leaf76]|uniref:alpha/beta fold hydrolase n=1 Tax=unclassified Acidovorax TaxID=2684926 RepID=UPI0006FEA2BA|nr:MULTISPECIES: alpha/beta fold hydrolase [unclassified Acidovorax]KQO26514.1 alpha/beta hydrolase [Acidovorax sp. Leaf76]KQO40289.1 alpha/beta hydrolase [Acidovorax sp. Leaf84]KQS42427.1 alpha/beta hydrolase [Acidovorax sp. Leaf191]